MKKYQIIYADPPWNYKVYSKKGLGRSAESHYPTMSIDVYKRQVCHGLSAKEHHPGTQHQAVPACSAVQRSYQDVYKRQP